MKLLYLNNFLIKIRVLTIPFLLVLVSSPAVSQDKKTGIDAQNAVIEAIIKEATDHSQLETLAYELLDGIGPRLVGTPQMEKAHHWAIGKYASWGIPARNQQWGEWRGWERGISHIDMVHPRVKSLEGTQLAWSPSTPSKGVKGEVLILPDLKDSIAFKNWLPTVKGKFVMISMLEPSGRPDYNWKEFATPESFTNMRKVRAVKMAEWNNRIRKTGYSSRSLATALENAGAAGLVMSNWSNGFGTNKIFGANTENIPSVDLSLEDYGLLYRLIENGEKPQINVVAQSKELGLVPGFNTIAEIKGTEKPDEYVILSAHLDSWDGGSGATDNGTGTIAMMEVMRILKKLYPNPKRTILVGHWGSEEQGLNGSRGFVADNPEIIAKTQAVFNQDNGTGRVTSVSGQGFMHSYDYVGRWLSRVPADVSKHIQTNFPGSPGVGSSDHVSFVAAGVPAFFLSSLSWSYGTYTWHTNRDTYDKIVFDDVRNNTILTAILAYMASEDPEFTSRERIVLPINSRTGVPGLWPRESGPTRKGGVKK